MLFMFEYRGAKALITEQFPDTAGSITSFRVESDVMSLNGRDPLQAEAEVGDDGKLHVVVRKSSVSSRSMVSTYNKSHGLNSMNSITPRASNLSGVEIYSVQSSKEPTPRASSFNQTDFYAMFAASAASKMPSPKHGYAGNLNWEVYSLQSSKGVTPRTSNFDEEMVRGKKKGGRSLSNEFLNGGLSSSSSYPAPNQVLLGAGSGGKKKEGGGGGNNKELHMFVWSSSASPVSEGNLRNAVNRAASTEFGVLDAASKAAVPHDIGASSGSSLSLNNPTCNSGSGSLCMLGPISFS